MELFVRIYGSLLLLYTTVSAEPLLATHALPMEWAEPGVREKDEFLPAQRRMKRASPSGALFHPEEYVQGRTNTGRNCHTHTEDFLTGDHDRRRRSPERGPAAVFQRQGSQSEEIFHCKHDLPLTRGETRFSCRRGIGVGL